MGGPRDDGWLGGQRSDGARVAALLQRLAELEKRTDPNLGLAAAANKDADATLALRLAGDLVNAVAGWAIDHKLGLASEGIEPPGIVHGDTLKLPEYTKLVAQLADHRHELNGRRLKSNTEADGWSAAVIRQFFVNVMARNFGGIPLRAARDLREALKALPFGETLPLLKPATTSAKVRYRELNFQLTALTFVQFKHSSGTKKYVAQNQVADAFGVGQEALRSWESRIRDGLGGMIVSDRLSKAKSDAVIASEMRSKYLKANTDRDRELFETMIEAAEAPYRSDALHEAGRRYQQFKFEVARPASGE